ncbi:MAG: hypothetical protein HYY49_07725 [Ignavibacteriales bacterium]|nr:hypothetical protein [Ignavibacteriales bacterium]
MPDDKPSGFKNIFKEASLAACIIGAVGGMSPELVKMIQPALRDDLPSIGQAVALTILAFIGFIAVLRYKEKNWERAFVLGIGAPALIGSLVGQAGTALASADVRFDVVSVLYAQPADASKTVRIVVRENESPHKISALFIRADENAVLFTTTGDTISVAVPGKTKSLIVRLSEADKGLELPMSGLSPEGTFDIRVTKNKFWKDFFQTLGNAKSPEYRIERAKK